MGARNLDRVKHLYNEVASICRENGLQPYLPHKNTDPIANHNISDEEVFKKDLHELESSSLVISYIGEPSLGVGAELAICITNNIPVITITESGSKVSRFLKGMLQTSGTAQFIEFESYLDLRQKMRECLCPYISSKSDAILSIPRSEDVVHNVFVNHH